MHFALRYSLNRAHISSKSCIISRNSSNFHNFRSFSSSKHVSKPLVVLGIESSCDETGIAVVNSQKEILSAQLHSQWIIHHAHGGVVPTLARRKHAEHINTLISCALLEAGVVQVKSHDLAIEHNLNIDSNLYLLNTNSNQIWLNDLLLSFNALNAHECAMGHSEEEKLVSSIPIVIHLDAVGVTQGPGLSGCLGVGIDTARALSRYFQKPLVGVNHILAHGHVVQLSQDLKFPYLALVVSGGHSQIQWVTGVDDATIMASTVDDAIGEAYDKVHRLTLLEELDYEQVEQVVKDEKTQLFNYLSQLKRNPLFIDDSILEFFKGMEESLNQSEMSHQNTENLTEVNILSKQLSFLQQIQTVPPINFKPMPHVPFVKGLLSQDLPEELAYVDNLEKSNKKSPPPPGAVVEKCALIYGDIVDILHIYDKIGIVLKNHQVLPQIVIDGQQLRKLKISTKLSSLISNHPMLPTILLPLPMHNTLTNSHTALSFSGLKTKIRNYCRTEEDRGQKYIDGVISSSDLPIYLRVYDNTTFSLDSYLENSTDSTNQPKSSQNNNINQINTSLDMKLNTQYSNNNLEGMQTLSPLFKLAISAQFQATAVEHLMSKMDRVIEYMTFGTNTNTNTNTNTDTNSNTNTNITNSKSTVNSDIDISLKSNESDDIHSGSCKISVRTGSRYIGDGNIGQYNEQYNYDFPSHLTSDYIFENHCTSVDEEYQAVDFHDVLLKNNTNRQMVIAGGVACNKYLTKTIGEHMKKHGFTTLITPPSLCTDNGVMIAWTAVQKLVDGQIARPNIKQKPRWPVGAEVFITKPQKLNKKE